VTLAANWTEALQWGALPAGEQVAVPVPLFPKREPLRQSP